MCVCVCVCVGRSRDIAGGQAAGRRRRLCTHQSLYVDDVYQDILILCSIAPAARRPCTATAQRRPSVTGQSCQYSTETCPSGPGPARAGPGRSGLARLDSQLSRMSTRPTDCLTAPLNRSKLTPRRPPAAEINCRRAANLPPPLLLLSPSVS